MESVTLNQRYAYVLSFNNTFYSKHIQQYLQIKIIHKNESM